MQNIEYPSYGCYKCQGGDRSRDTAGSTCCDPQKQGAKMQAQAENAGLQHDSEEGKVWLADKKNETAPYDKKRYNELVKENISAWFEDHRKLLDQDGAQQFEVHLESTRFFGGGAKGSR